MFPQSILSKFVTRIPRPVPQGMFETTLIFVASLIQSDHIVPFILKAFLSVLDMRRLYVRKVIQDPFFSISFEFIDPGALLNQLLIITPDVS